jgi:hypothetical protein
MLYILRKSRGDGPCKVWLEKISQRITCVDGILESSSHLFSSFLIKCLCLKLLQNDAAANSCVCWTTHPYYLYCDVSFLIKCFPTYGLFLVLRTCCWMCGVPIKWFLAHAYGKKRYFNSRMIAGSAHINPYGSLYSFLLLCCINSEGLKKLAAFSLFL